MIGNDIVDLALAKVESNWKRNGYLDKIFTKEEQFSILNSDDRDKTVWNLWSRKEAAYKIYNRQTNIRAYIPSELYCRDLFTIDEIVFGKIICKGNTYYTRTEVTSDLVHTVAVNYLSDFERLKYLKDPVVIVKAKTIPSYYDGSQLKPLSISHHGRFKRTVTLF